MAVHSFHLFSDASPDELQATASVELMVEVPPSVDSGYFWAMQVDWDDGSGAHIGLQWWPGYPRNRAANWGGYGPDGQVLPGTALRFPSTLGNENTCDYPWEPRSWYRLEVTPDGTGSINGEVLRRLEVAPQRIVRVGVWTEMFARCSAPMTQVRWRGLDRVRCNYEPTCSNTASWREGDDLVQAAGLPRWPWKRPHREAFL